MTLRSFLVLASVLALGASPACGRPDNDPQASLGSPSRQSCAEAFSGVEFTSQLDDALGTFRACASAAEWFEEAPDTINAGVLLSGACGAPTAGAKVPEDVQSSTVCKDFRGCVAATGGSLSGPALLDSLERCGAAYFDDQRIPADGTQGDASTIPTGPAREKPVVTVPDGPPPASLASTDIDVGTGTAAQDGFTVTVHYVGVAYSTGEQFDSSWDRQAPFPFRLGAGDVIPGWDQGVAGMRVGGRHRLIIPPALAYGTAGFPPVIGPDETLVFVVDLLAVTN